MNKPRVPPPGESETDPYRKEIDAIGFALDRLQTHLHWATEHTATFEAKRRTDPAAAEEELKNLAESLRSARRYFARLKELILAGYAIDPEKQLPKDLSRPVWLD